MEQLALQSYNEHLSQNGEKEDHYNINFGDSSLFCNRVFWFISHGAGVEI